MIERQTRFSIIFLSYLAELTAVYPLYYLGVWLLKTPTPQVLTLWAAALLGLAAVVFNLLLAARSLRLFFLWVINLAGALGLTYLISRISVSGSIQPLPSGANQFLSSACGWALLVFIGLLTLRAMVMVNQPIDYQQATHRFEASAGTLFTGILLFNILSIPLRPVALAIGICLLTNIGALAFSRTRSSKPFLLGLALLIYGVIIAAAGWLAVSLLPILTGTSRWLWGTTAPPVKRFTAKLFRWLFNYGNARGESGGLADQGTKSGSSGWNAAAGHLPPEWLQHLAEVIVGAAVIIGVLTLAAVLMYIIVRLWYRRNPARLVKYSGGANDNVVRRLIHMLIRLFIRINLWLQPLRVGSMDITELYRCLLIWGNLRHQPRQPDETPYEYGRRLELQFPKQREGISILTASYVGWRYGKNAPDGKSLVQMRALLRQLYY